MTDSRDLPDEWPVDRDLESLEAKLGPFEDYSEWQRIHTEEMEERLGETGYRLMLRLEFLKTCLAEYDMTPDEAVECLEYEIGVFRDETAP